MAPGPCFQPSDPRSPGAKIHSPDVMNFTTLKIQWSTRNDTNESCNPSKCTMRSLRGQANGKEEEFTRIDVLFDSEE